jgi:hypothetical protein
MNKPLFLETEAAFGHFDEAKHVLVVTCSGQLTDETTRQVYQWIEELTQINPSAAIINGAIFDFQKVTDLEGGNLLAALEGERINRQFDLKALPIAVIVPSNYLRAVFQQAIAESPQPERRRIVSSIEEAFEFLEQFKQKSDQPSVDILDMPRATCQYDEAHYLAYITYYGVLTAEVTAQVYSWLARVFDHYGVKTMRRCVFDFRNVSRFHPSNTNKITESSANLNRNYDMSHIPVALIVQSYYQEQFVQSTLRHTPQEERKHVVKSIDEAWAFMDSFHGSKEDGGN